MMTMSAPVPCLADLGGLPFLDDGFTARRLLAVTAAVRYANASRRGLADGIPPAQAGDWLSPTRAFMLSTASTPMPALPLTIARRERLTGPLAALAAGMLSWRELLALPVRYARLSPAGGAISASSRDWPQHVLLAEEAFATGQELAEQVLHELAHQWLYLIEDIWPLERHGAATLTLPSGTRDRSPAEVLGAAHVAAVLIRFYRQDHSGWAAARVRALTSYGTGCLDLAGTVSQDLTEAGTLIAQRLKEAF
jgi:hypothetical protein